MDALGDVLVGGVEERVDAHPGLRHEADGVHHPVEFVARADHLGDPVGEAGQVLVVLHVEFEQRCRLREPVHDPFDQIHSLEPGAHDLSARFLSDPGDVKRNRRIGDDPRDEDALSFEKPCHISPFLPNGRQWPIPMPPSTGITAPEM